MLNRLRYQGVCFVIALSISTQAQAKVKKEQPMWLFVLMGQSNMIGRAEVPPNQVLDKRIWTFTKARNWKIAKHPVDFDEKDIDDISHDPNAGYGPALPFAKTLLNLNKDIPKIGLIPCAKGNSYISQWQRNLTAQSLYGSCLWRALEASKKGVLKGILFFQGESDASPPPPDRPEIMSCSNNDIDSIIFASQKKCFLRPAPTSPNFLNYPNEMSLVISQFRTDLQASLPVVYAQLGQTTDLVWDWWEFQKRQELVNLPHTRMIRTLDLPLKDSAHFTKESYDEIGFRFAKEMNQLLTTSPEIF
jgi:hypothetical protein